jgi:hypothetical protein
LYSLNYFEARSKISKPPLSSALHDETPFKDLNCSPDNGAEFFGGARRADIA